MYAHERWWDCSRRNSIFTIQACNPACKNLTIESKEVRGNCSICGRPYVDVQAVPVCARLDEYKVRREEILDRATAELDRLMSIKGFRAAGAAYNRIASEFFDRPCPFYEAQESA